jgi:hypothetical protein
MDVSRIQAKINNIAERFSLELNRLSEELEELISSSNPAPIAAAGCDELAVIEERALSSPLSRTHLSNAGEHSRRVYMRVLSAAAGTDFERLLFARRIGAGSGSDWDAERLAAERLNIVPDEIAAYLNDLSIYLLIDCLTIAFLTDEASDEVLGFIADTADILGLSEQDIKSTSKLVAENLHNIVNGDNTLVNLSAKWIKHGNVNTQEQSAAPKSRIFIRTVYTNRGINNVIVTGNVKAGQELAKGFFWTDDSNTLAQSLIAPRAGYVSYEASGADTFNGKEYDIFIT